MHAYPASTAARDRFVLARRPARPRHDPWRHQGLLVEDERDADGRTARVATIFLTGRECPWRCAMCDLWRYTIAEDTPAGAIPAQIAAALGSLREQREAIAQLKLYNAGSFFDPRAVPISDYDAVAAQVAGLERVVVESHPALIGARVDRFLDALAGRTRLEVAMGLETAHPGALDRLHKRITLDRFARAAEDLRRRGAALRVFLLISPPFVPDDEQEHWLRQSLGAAWSCGAAVVSLIPTRPGNGAIDALAAEGLFRAPDLGVIEHAFEIALAPASPRGRVFVDLWELRRFSTCDRCFEPRRTRLHMMNLEQRLLAAHGPCPGCADVSPTSVPRT